MNVLDSALTSVYCAGDLPPNFFSLHLVISVSDKTARHSLRLSKFGHPQRNCANALELFSSVLQRLSESLKYCRSSH
jgi:hypothetical protein